MTGIDYLDLEEDRRKIRDYFFSHGIPAYLTEQRTFTALSYLAGYRQSAGKGTNDGIPRQDSRKRQPAPNGRKQLLKILEKTGNAILSEMECKTVLKSIGINVTEPVFAGSAAEAVAAARKVGFPVVMKVVSPEITHKSDVGGVKLNLSGEDQVKSAYADIIAAAQKAEKATIDGVSIQKMAPPGLELVIGMTKDPQFGPMLMFGLGGIFVEVLQDVSFRIVPLSRKDASDMIRGIKGHRLLGGFRGRPAVDINHLEELLMRLSGFITENPEIKEMDINPLIAYEKGAVAVDARIVLEER